MDGATQVLLVEGTDDKHVVRHLTSRQDDMPQFCISGKEGRDNLIEVPDNPETGGTIVDGTPRIGIWLMPDNASAGELEDFVSQMIPEDDPVWPLSLCYIDGIPEDHRKFAGKKIQRAKLHAWLATREDPRLMGAAIGAGDLPVDGPLSTTFADWLRQLFS